MIGRLQDRHLGIAGLVIPAARGPRPRLTGDDPQINRRASPVSHPNLTGPGVVSVVQAGDCRLLIPNSGLAMLRRKEGSRSAALRSLARSACETRGDADAVPEVGKPSWPPGTEGEASR